MARRKWSWTPLQKDRAEKVLAVADEMRNYWPLTLRQIYYQLIAKGFIENNRSQYTMLSTLVKWMRIDEMLPWEALEDRTRKITDKRGFTNVDSFVNQELDYFLEGYTRCLIQGQSSHIEVWAEKEALLRIFEKTVNPYCIRVVICKGYDSVTFIEQFYRRAETAIMKGQQPIVLYFGDLDPSGVQMFEATIETLENEMGLWGVEYKRVALNPEHIKQYNLISNPNAAKTSDPRYHNYVGRFGNIAVELDALHPEELQKMIRNSIEAEVDMDLFENQKEQEENDIEFVDNLRAKVMDAIEGETDMFD